MADRARRPVPAWRPWRERRDGRAEAAPAAGDASPLPLLEQDDPRTWDADDAVTALYAAHWRRLVGLAVLLVHDRGSAEEVVQDAFIALHSRWRRLEDPDAALAYLRQIVVNRARDVLRRREVAERLRPLPDPEPEGPEELAVRSAQHRHALRALDALPLRQREVLVLRYSADLSEADIAAALGISRGAVKTHAHRGLTALRAALSGQDPTDPTRPRDHRGQHHEEQP